MNKPSIFIMTVAALVTAGAYFQLTATPNAKDKAMAEIPQHSDENVQTATFGGGCFWCTEAVFEQLDGVLSVTSGYAGGDAENPTYRQVVTGRTGHAEVVQIAYDPDQISYAELLDWHWRSHNPTTLNRQGADVGTQYRSIILYENQEQQKIAQESLQNAQKSFSDPIVTEVVPLEKFYPAEEYHQDYYSKNPTAGYCQFVIAPKLDKLNLD